MPFAVSATLGYWLLACVTQRWLFHGTVVRDAPSASRLPGRSRKDTFAMVLGRPGDDRAIVQAGDLVIGQSQDAGQDLVGVLAQQRRRLRRLARHGAELQR